MFLATAEIILRLTVASGYTRPSTFGAGGFLGGLLVLVICSCNPMDEWGFALAAGWLHERSWNPLSYLLSLFFLVGVLLKVLISC